MTKAAITAAITPFASLTSFGKGITEAVDRAPKSSAPSDLKITGVKCAYSGGGLFVKILTNQDIWGSGEAVDAIGGTYYLVQRIGKQITGKSPLNPNRIFEELRKTLRPVFLSCADPR